MKTTDATKSETLVHVFLLAIALAVLASRACCSTAEPAAYPPQPAIVGTWQVDDGAAGSWSLDFAADHQLTYRSGGNVLATGTWSVDGDQVVMDSTAWSSPLTSTWSVRGDVLTLVGWFEGERARVAR